MTNKVQPLPALLLAAALALAACDADLSDDGPAAAGEPHELELPRGLTERETADLVRFLENLTGGIPLESLAPEPPAGPSAAA